MLKTTCICDICGSTTIVEKYPYYELNLNRIPENPIMANGKLIEPPLNFHLCVDCSDYIRDYLISLKTSNPRGDVDNEF